MNKFLNFLLIFIFMFENSIGQTSQNSLIKFLYISRYENCKGKDSSNYTIVGQFTRDQACSIGSNSGLGDTVVISTDSNGQKSTNILNVLAASVIPGGAYTQVEVISIVGSGPLQGKYVYQKRIQLRVLYTKKCSSVLGYSFANTKSAMFIISDKLDPNVFTVPTGAFEEFQKIATTICKGYALIF